MNLNSFESSDPLRIFPQLIWELRPAASDFPLDFSLGFRKLTQLVSRKRPRRLYSFGYFCVGQHLKVLRGKTLGFASQGFKPAIAFARTFAAISKKVDNCAIRQTRFRFINRLSQPRFLVAKFVACRPVLWDQDALIISRIGCKSITRSPQIKLITRWPELVYKVAGKHADHKGMATARRKYEVSNWKSFFLAITYLFFGMNSLNNLVFSWNYPYKSVFD